MLFASASLVHAEQQWAGRVERGKALYTALCERCHGAGGADTSYPGAKTLVGITQRRTSKEIIEPSASFVGREFEGEDAAALVAYLDTFRADAYAQPELLVETGWVELHARDANVRVVDMRDAAAYAAGHIPAAVRVEEGPLRSAEDRFTYLPKPEVLAQMMAKAGIGSETHVVIYDDQGGKMAARLWYVLNAYGHTRVSLLNGGWKQWVAEKRTTTTEVPQVAAATFVPKATPTLTCPSPELLARRPNTVVLDARSPEEHRGETVSPGAAKAGRIPGAVNVDWKENVTGPNLVFKPAADLLALYQRKGITPDKEIVVHCASGGRAAQTLFTLKLLGYPKVKIYYGSFADYSSRADAPVEK